MVTDTIHNAALYKQAAPGIATALDYLASHDFTATEPGRFELDSGCYAIVQDYTTKSAEEKRWEAHRAYIDVQFIVSGTELIGYTPLDGLTEVEAYNPDKDIIWFEGSGGFLNMPAGSFMILYPDEGHMPGVSVSEPAQVRKVVVKVPVQQPKTVDKQAP